MSRRPNSGECKGCGRTVLWVTGPTGGRFAVNPFPDDAGTVAIGRGPDLELVSRTPRDGDALYREHAATCRHPVAA